MLKRLKLVLHLNLWGRENGAINIIQFDVDFHHDSRTNETLTTK
jgi:hypothetical protein